jgi:hypothetical protein
MICYATFSKYVPAKPLTRSVLGVKTLKTVTVKTLTVYETAAFASCYGEIRRSLLGRRHPVRALRLRGKRGIRDFAARTAILVSRRLIPGASSPSPAVS